jgi:hypothetical protein
MAVMLSALAVMLKERGVIGDGVVEDQHQQLSGYYY